MFALLMLGAQPQPDEQWRVMFDKHYGLADGEVLKRVPPPFIDERIDFLLEGRENADTRGLVALVVEWSDKPRTRSSHYSTTGEGITLSRIWELVLKRKPYEIDAPRELLDREFAGDWVVRRGADPALLLDALARIISEEIGDRYEFAARKETYEVLVVRGRITRDVDPAEVVKLDLPLEDIRFREYFGGSTTLPRFYSALSAASGWAVIDETDQKQFFVRIEYGDDKNRELAPPEALQIPKEQMEQLVDAIQEQTGLEFGFEQREITRWCLERN